MTLDADILGSGPLIQICSVFTVGLLSSLTPCVYPLIPITLAVCGAQDEPSRIRSFFLSLAYVLGLVLTYTILGIVSAQTGMVFGSILGNPIVVIVLSLFLFVLSLITLEVIPFRMLSKTQTWASTIGGDGIKGSFLMGTVSGLVAAPCIGPVLAVVLGVAASSQSSTWGGILLLTYSLGLGVPFLILGTFSGLIQKLPKCGNWMHLIKFLIGTSLLVVALFLLNSSLHFGRSIPVFYTTPLFLILVSVAGLAGMFLSYAAEIYSKRHIALRIFGSVSIATTSYASLFIQSPPTEGNTAASEWIAKLEDGITLAKTTHTPIILDLSAEWCDACHELDTKTFSDSGIRDRFQRFTRVRVDFTDMSEYTNKLASTFGIQGLPSVLFLSPEGKELPGTRVTGFMEPEEFNKRLDTVLEQNSRT